MKTALSIAGSDCSGGAGIQADIKTMSALGVYAMSVIVSVVAENTSRVISVEDMPVRCIADQIDAVFTDMPVNAVKVGMLSSPACMRIVAEKLQKYAPDFIVADPVMYAKNGCPLMHEDAVDALKSEIVPIATLITPNIPEAERIAGFKIETLADRERAARVIFEQGAKFVLIKGGHLADDASDLLFDGEKFTCFSHSRIRTKNTHGTGCTLSSAIASFVALGDPVGTAVEKAKEYVTGAIEHALDLGHGCGPTHHFFRFYDGK